VQLPMPEEIRRALDGGAGDRVELVDPQTRARYVVVAVEEFERMHEPDSAAIRDTYPAQEAAARAAGWDDPIMDEYNG